MRYVLLGRRFLLRNIAWHFSSYENDLVILDTILQLQKLGWNKYRHNYKADIEDIMRQKTERDIYCYAVWRRFVCCVHIHWLVRKLWIKNREGCGSRRPWSTSTWKYYLSIEIYISIRVICLRVGNRIRNIINTTHSTERCWDIKYINNKV